MPSLARGRPSAATPRQSRGPVELPVYEPVLHPLNQNALHELQALPRSHKLSGLNERLKAANNHLTEAAAEINDRLTGRSVRLEKLKKRREPTTSQVDVAEAEQNFEDAKTNTEEMTAKLDQRMRDMIDIKHDVSSAERALQDLEANAVSNRGQIAPTQSTLGASQMRSMTGRRSGGNDDEEDPDETPGLYSTLQRKLASSKEEYQASSLTQRYSNHNDYVSFKKIVHDAQYPGDSAPPLPHASTWFAVESKGTNSQSFATTLQNESDDDFQVESERITVRCPITLLRMKEPMQSTKCPHNFEKAAIFEMLRMSELGGDGLPHRDRAAMTNKAVKCPECEILLTAEDLQPNPVLLRKIKRQEEEERRQEEQSDESDAERGNESSMTNPAQIGSSPVQTATSYKRERMSQAPSARSRNGASMVPSTQIQDLTTLDEEDTSYD